MSDTWVEVDTSKLRQNYTLLRQLLGARCHLMAVVKANAYGHGMIDFSLLAQSMGVDWFAVGTIEEALALRAHGIVNPILVVIGMTEKEAFREATNKHIALTISGFEGLTALKKLNQHDLRSSRIHLKIDTGMHRQGFLVDDIPKLAQHLKDNRISRDVLEGIYTHFGGAEDPADHEDTLVQMAQFHRGIEMMRSAGFTPLIHAATTTSMLIFPESRFDLVRVGAGFYGIWPSLETKAEFEKAVPLQSALSWKTRINEIKRLPEGSKIGYGFTETLEKDSAIAICPVGYWHGYRRHLSNVGQVLINGERAHIVGRISMYVTAIDISDISGVKIGDVVTLIGKDRDQEITLEEVASWAGTLNKDIVSGIHPLVPRISL